MSLIVINEFNHKSSLFFSSTQQKDIILFFRIHNFSSLEELKTKSYFSKKVYFNMINLH